MSTSMETRERINNMDAKFNFIQSRLPDLKYKSKMASIEISKIMNDYEAKKSQLICLALSKHSTYTDKIVLESINELKRETLEKIYPLQAHINLYRDVYTENQCLLIQYVELVENEHFPFPVYDSFSKVAEIVSENLEENPINNPYISM